MNRRVIRGLLPFLLLLPFCASAVGAEYTGTLQEQRVALEAELSRNPDSYEASWNMARVLIDLGNFEDSKDDRKAAYIQAVEHARHAVSLVPDDTWGHHYLAASVGKLALTEGGKRKIELSKEVRDEALKAVELDPRNDKSHHILGRWNREVHHLGRFMKIAAKVVYGGVPKGATDEKAVEHFQRAIEIDPTHVNHRLELGITYMKMKEYDRAIEAFNIALSLPDSDPNDPVYKLEAEKLLKKCKKKAQPAEDW